MYQFFSKLSNCGQIFNSFFYTSIVDCAGFNVKIVEVSQFIFDIGIIINLFETIQTI